MKEFNSGEYYKVGNTIIIKNVKKGKRLDSSFADGLTRMYRNDSSKFYILGSKHTIDVQLGIVLFGFWLGIAFVPGKEWGISFIFGYWQLDIGVVRCRA